MDEDVKGPSLPADKYYDMIWIAKIFFYLHTAICCAYLAIVARAFVRTITGGKGFSFDTMQVGDILVMNNDKVVDGMTYLVLGLFLLYAEIYMYRVYTVATSFTL